MQYNGHNYCPMDYTKEIVLGKTCMTKTVFKLYALTYNKEKWSGVTWMRY